MKALIFVAGLTLGCAFAHWWNADEAADARAELADLNVKHSGELAQVRAAALTRLQTAQARSDALQIALGDTEQRLSATQKDTQREIERNTTGRACLNGRTVGLLNRAAADRTATLPAPGSEPVAEDAAAAADTEVATDTDVATWANQAIEQYNACRARLGALIDWFPPAPSPPITTPEQAHD